MVAESFANFATTALNGAISAAATNFTVTGGQGSLFPAANFLVTIDSEVIFVGTRTGDSFFSLVRGFDNSTAAAHSTNVTVQIADCAYNYNHLWSNVPDTFVPEVPPQQISGLAPSLYDNEFEETGTWTLYPSPSGATAFDAGSSLDSHLLLNRASPDNTMYTAYIAFAPGASSWTATCKLSEGTNILVSNSDQAQTSFFVSDLSNPTTGPDTSNRVKLNTVCGNTTSGGVLAPSSRLVRSVKDTSGTAAFVGAQVPVSPGAPLWLRMNCDGSGNYQTYMSGDGVTYWLLSYQSGVTFTVASLGISFHVYNPSGKWVAHQAAVDSIRVVVGQASPPYGR